MFILYYLAPYFLSLGILEPIEKLFSCSSFTVNANSLFVKVFKIIWNTAFNSLRVGMKYVF